MSYLLSISFILLDVKIDIKIKISKPYTIISGVCVDGYNM